MTTPPSEVFQLHHALGGKPAWELFDDAGLQTYGRWRGAVGHGVGCLRMMACTLIDAKRRDWRELPWRARSIQAPLFLLVEYGPVVAHRVWNDQGDFTSLPGLRRHLSRAFSTEAAREALRAAKQHHPPTELLERVREIRHGRFAHATPDFHDGFTWDALVGSEELGILADAAIGYWNTLDLGPTEPNHSWSPRKAVERSHSPIAWLLDELSAEGPTGYPDLPV